MKTRFTKITLIALALGLSVGLALAADSKPPVAAPAKTSTKPAPAASATKVTLIDVNSASKDELKTLPGVSDELAAKIIAGRPYLSKAHLLTRKIVDAGGYENIRTLVIAKQKQLPPAKPASR